MYHWQMRVYIAKKKKAGIEEEIEEALKQWFTKMREEDAPVTGPLLRLKSEELTNKMGKNDFVHICLYLFIHGPFALFTHSVNILKFSGPKVSPTSGVYCIYLYILFKIRENHFILK